MWYNLVMKYLAVLGRLPKLSLAELTSLYGNVEMHGADLATFECAVAPDLKRLGGTLKLAEELPEGFNYLIDALADLPEGKITLGVSDYRRKTSARRAQGEALKLKKILQRRGRSVRVLQNKTAVLSTATSHHNQIAEKKNHVEIIMTDFGNFNLIGVQNISEYAKRDQARPARDAKVGMLPPKLAQILINLAGALPEKSLVLDPFCGTGVVLQEAHLMGYRPYGTDLSERMVDYTKRNLEWIGCEDFEVEVGDATVFKWNKEISAVVAEAFLGQPMSQPPADIKLKQEKMRCKEIILGFLKNLAGQVGSDTPVVLAIPAWLRVSGGYSRLNILDEVEDMGYNVKKFINLGQKDLLYYREGQVVAREIIILRKK
ncbi:hypothetical protein IKG06_03110 [Candidatus Saccharibacteria bacterium]|nr:hypothetical protein [Candidatus Saccharibacteria bacterium]